MICNIIVKQFVKNSVYANQYINELKGEKLAADKVNKQSNVVIDAYKKQKEENSITSVEVVKDNKK